MNLNIFKLKDSIEIVKEALVQDRNLVLISTKEKVNQENKKSNIDFYFKSNEVIKDIEC